MQSPWVTYNDYLKAIFDGDKEVTVQDVVTGDDGNYYISVLVANSIKASAIDQILKKDVPMGNVNLHVDVECTSNDAGNVYEAAFAGNPHFSRFVTLETPFHTEMSFCIMTKEVIQFYNDDISDPWGNYNGLAEDIMKEITIPNENVSYATEAVDPNANVEPVDTDTVQPDPAITEPVDCDY